MLCVGLRLALALFLVARASVGEKSQLQYFRLLNQSVTTLIPPSTKKKHPLYLQVIPGSPAARAGVRPGDILLELNGAKVEAARDVASALRYKAGETISLKLLSKTGTERVLRLRIEEAISP